MKSEILGDDIFTLFYELHFKNFISYAIAILFGFAKQFDNY